MCHYFPVFVFLLRLTSPEVHVDDVQDDRNLSDKQGFNLDLGHIDRGPVLALKLSPTFPQEGIVCGETRSLP